VQIDMPLKGSSLAERFVTNMTNMFSFFSLPSSASLCTTSSTASRVLDFDVLSQVFSTGKTFGALFAHVWLVILVDIHMTL
jgi:hypothetical protein